nr:hypothetical protein CFP56_05869 [Quercus suber]
MTNFIPDDSSRSEHLYIITLETSNSANPNNIVPEPSNSTNPNNITPKASQSGKNKWVWISIAISASALLVTFFCILCYLQRRRTVELQGVDNEIQDENRLLSLVISEGSTSANEIPNDRKKVPDINVYSYEYSESIIDQAFMNVDHI